MVDPERYQHIRLQIRAHVGVQIGVEFAVVENIGLDDGARDTQPIILCLAHQRLRNGRDRGFHLHRTVRIDVGDLGVSHAEDPKPPVFAVHIAGHGPADDFQSALVLIQRQLTEPGKVRDKVARIVVRRAQHIGELFPLPIEIDQDVPLLVQTEASEIRHALTSALFHRLSEKSRFVNRKEALRAGGFRKWPALRQDVFFLYKLAA